MAIGAEQAAIRTVIAGAIVDNVGENGRGIDALIAIRQAEAIVRALELAGCEIRRRTWVAMKRWWAASIEAGRPL